MDNVRLGFGVLILVASRAALAIDLPYESPRWLNAQDLPVPIDAGALQRQYTALSAMPSVTVQYSRRGPIHVIKGNTGLVVGADQSDLTEGDTASDMLELLKDVLLAVGGESLVVRSSGCDESTCVLRLNQTIRELPVVNGRVAIVYDSATGLVRGVSATFLPDQGLPTKAALATGEAQEIVTRALVSAEKVQTKDVEIIGAPFLGYFADSFNPTPPYLVWVVRAQFGGMQELYYVDAIGGVIVGRQMETSTLSSVVVYNANNQLVSIPDTLPPEMDLNQIISDQDAKQAFDRIQIADSKVRQRFPQAITDGHLPTNASIVVRYNFSPNQPNAGHLIGAGGIDWLLFSGAVPASPGVTARNSFTASSDIVYHEYAHGVAKRLFGIEGDVYGNEALPLHEGFSDFLATVIDVASRTNSLPVPATWILGDGAFPSNPALGDRSFANPAGDALAYYKGVDYYPQLWMPPGNQHANSGIVAHAYYLLVNGGLHARATDPSIPDINVGAQGEAVARDIFFRAFSDFTMDQAPTFLKLKTAALAVAASRYSPVVGESVEQAFDAVGIGFQCTAPPQSPPSYTLVDLLCAGKFKVTWPALPGATRYLAQTTLTSMGWLFASTVTDGNVLSCRPKVPGPSYFRMRACNACGCGPWSSNSYLPYWSPCP